MKKNTFVRGGGILLPIFSLPSKYGIGTLGDSARKFINYLAYAKQKYWQVLPLGPTSYGDSPYQSLSAMAGNPYFIDLDLLVKEGLLELSEIEAFDYENCEKEVDYGKLYQERFQILFKAFARFDVRNEEFLQYVEQEQEWLEDYTLFMALKAHFEQKEWLLWDRDIRDREEEALCKYKELLKNDILFHEFLQYQFHVQWLAIKEYANTKGIQIIGDIPLYLSLDSADVWAHRTEFELMENGRPTLVAGCPPDAFSEDGQKWGNPLYDWKTMEENEFSWWKLRMKKNAQNYDVIRIDHFIGVVRYYSVPAEEENARNGKWRVGPGIKLVKAIEESIGDCKIIAEDLGVAVPGVKRLLKKAGWPGMKVLIFAFDGNTAHEYLPHNFDTTQLVLYGATHDNETLAGFFFPKDDSELKYMYDYLQIQSKDELIDALIRLAYSSIADVVIFQMQDILSLGNETRMNLPSTLGTNWRWRMEEEQFGVERLDFLRQLVELYNR